MRLIISVITIVCSFGANAAEHLENLDNKFTCTFINDQQIPLVVTPNDPSLTLADFQEWIESHPDVFQALVTQHGALLFRNFPILTANDFASVVKSVTGRPLLDYKGGEGSRTKVAHCVYTSTEAPQDYQIPLHNELSCTSSPPDYISFFCDIAPPAGSGQTILGSTEKVTQAVMSHPDVWNLFYGRVLKHISRHPPAGNFYSNVNVTHKTWQEAFETEDKTVVEAICKEKGFECTWNGDWVEVTRYSPAIREPDEHFDSPYWCNQAHLYHFNSKLCGGMMNYVLANMLYCMPSTYPYDIRFEDDSSIPKEIIYTIYDILEQQIVKFDWQHRDLLLLDNFKALHGRAPYNGPRRILVAMVQ